MCSKMYLFSTPLNKNKISYTKKAREKENKATTSCVYIFLEDDVTL